MLTVAVTRLWTDELLKNEADNVSRNLAEIDAFYAAKEGTPGIDRAVGLEHKLIGPVVRFGEKKRFIVAAAVGGGFEQLVESAQGLSGGLYAGTEFELGKLR